MFDIGLIDFDLCTLVTWFGGVMNEIRIFQQMFLFQITYAYSHTNRGA